MKKSVEVNGVSIGEAEDWNGVASVICDHAMRGHDPKDGANTTSCRLRAQISYLESMGIPLDEIDAWALRNDNAVETTACFEVTIPRTG